jgi:hypothetical protein
MDNKRRLFRLIETYVNDLRGDAVKEFYGNNTIIKIHSMRTGVKDNSIMFEVVVKLGDTINEDVLNDAMVQVLIQDALVYFFPESIIKIYTIFDV